jgi:glycerol-3-phosphate cytidylyltransferase
MVIGYTTGVFDLFHVGHLNLLKNAKTMCDKLVVGVTIDKLVRYKYKKSVIPFKERIEIVKSCRYVDLAIPQNKINKLEAFKKIKYDILFVGDDWYENPKWKYYETILKKEKVKIIFLPYTTITSSTLINATLKKLRKK